MYVNVSKGGKLSCVHLQEFELAVHIKDVGCQHAVLQHCREAPNFSAESMLKLAYFSKAALNSNPDVTRQALQAALQLLLSKGHAVPHDQVAHVIMHDTLLIKGHNLQDVYASNYIRCKLLASQLIDGMSALLHKLQKLHQMSRLRVLIHKGYKATESFLLQ